MKVVTKDEIIDEFGVIIEVSDEDLEIIKNNPQYYNDPDFSNKVSLSEGDNAVVTLLNMGGVNEILSQADKLLKKYKSVSWYDRGHKKFYTRTQNAKKL